jgi:hypothetical protein
MQLGIVHLDLMHVKVIYFIATAMLVFVARFGDIVRHACIPAVRCCIATIKMRRAGRRRGRILLFLKKKKQKDFCSSRFTRHADRFT